MSVALPFLEAMQPRSLRRRTGRPELCPAAHGLPLRSQWRPHARLDAAIDGSQFELPAILEPLQAVKDDLLVLSGLTLNPARALGDGGGDHARAMASFLDRPAPAEDRRRRPPRRRLRRPGWPPSESAMRPASRRSRSAARGARTPANATTVTVVLISRTFRGAAKRRPSPSKSIRAWSSIGSSVSRPDSDGGEDPAQSRPAQQEHPRLRRRRCPAAQSNAGCRRPPQAG